MLNPYLNLNRNGNSAGFNYLTLVRPMQAGNAAIQRLQQQLSANQVLGPATGRFAGDSLTTGHPVMFLNTGGYFLNTGGALNSSRSGIPNPTQVSPAAGRFRSGVR
jgi:hypothetical protein